MTMSSTLEEDPHASRARARLGTVLQDKWKLDSLLGIGGMAAVYAATHRNGKRVAVKMLHTEFNHDEEVRTRFLQEGYAANTIQHDGAVSVLDDDLAPDGSAFIVMEMLEGETVEQRWERGGQRLPVADVLWIAEQLLDVLVAAHAKSVVHRDIKPENLFVTKGGAVKVLDFGIAKVFERQHTRQSTTRAGMVMGTPAFMAPEQALAHWEEVDGRTDIWAVGATMFMLMSGQHVHEAQSSQEQLILSATAPARSLATVAPGVPRQVVAIVDRALAFDRSGRWPDATAMQAAVRAVLDALARSDPALSGRRSSAAPPGGATTLSAPTAGATLIDTTGLASGVAAWMQEREVRQLETTRLRAAIAEAQERLSAAKKSTADAQKRLDAGRAERTSLEQWFTRQVGTRTAAVEDARKEVRRTLVAIARQALADRGVFGAEVDPARDQIATLTRAAESASRDVVVHEAALEAYDPPSLRTGVVLLGVAFVLALALLVAPIVWRATRVVEAPPPTHSAQGRGPS
jgi:eukaryotic-like serine/threonine-protein kinase